MLTIALQQLAGVFNYFATVDHRAMLQRLCFKIPYCEEDLILWLR